MYRNTARAILGHVLEHWCNQLRPRNKALRGRSRKLELSGDHVTQISQGEMQLRMGHMIRDPLPPSTHSGMSRFVSSLSCARLGTTIRQVLASKPTQQPIQVHGWVKSVRLQKRVAFAMVHDGTTSKSLQVVFQNPVHAKASVIPISSVER